MSDTNAVSKIRNSPLMVSVVINATLVVTITALVFQVGRFVENNTSLTQSLTNLTARVETLERHPQVAQNTDRISRLEEQVASDRRVASERWGEISKQLDRITEKLEKK